jgi:hypothetical protein
MRITAVLTRFRKWISLGLALKNVPTAESAIKMK